MFRSERYVHYHSTTTTPTIRLSTSEARPFLCFLFPSRSFTSLTKSWRWMDAFFFTTYFANPLPAF